MGMAYGEKSWLFRIPRISASSPFACEKMHHVQLMHPARKHIRPNIPSKLSYAYSRAHIFPRNGFILRELEGTRAKTENSPNPTGYHRKARQKKTHIKTCIRDELASRRTKLASKCDCSSQKKTGFNQSAQNRSSFFPLFIFLQLHGIFLVSFCISGWPKNK